MWIMFQLRNFSKEPENIYKLPKIIVMTLVQGLYRKCHFHMVIIIYCKKCIHKIMKFVFNL